MCWVAWTTLTLPKYAGGLGFRDIEAFNDALLAKLGWRLLKNPTSLAARVLLGKYCLSSPFLSCSAPGSASHGWRSILVGRDVLLQGLGWVVGNGESIRVWEDPWLSLSFPSTPIGPPPLAAMDLRVSDLLCPITNEWRLDKIRQHLPQYEETIRKLITSSVPLCDSWTWLPEKSGVYSTKTGYGIIVAQAVPTPAAGEFNWLKHIWNVKTSPKIKDFLWKGARKAIPVSSNLSRRGIAPFACKRCGGVEDDLHVFFSCPFAQQVWASSPVMGLLSSLPPSMELLLKNLSTSVTLPPVGISCPLWPWLLWRLWKGRNALLFEDIGWSISETISKAITDAKEWQSAQGSRSIPVTTTPSRAHQALITPDPTVLTCCVDAAWDPLSGSGGLGGIFSGPGCSLLHNFSDPHRFLPSALVAEAMAIRRAVMVAAAGNVNAVSIWSDSQTLIKMLKEKSSTPALYGVFSDILYFSRVFDSVSFKFIPRLSNVAADAVAKSALQVCCSSSFNGV